ncbi:MAG: ABC transporter permease [Thermacetogeniaceae bacterium]
MLRQCLAIIGREVRYLLRDRSLRHILLLGSLLGLLLFWGIYGAQVLKDIPTAVVDLDGTKQSRELVETIRNAEYLKVVAMPESFEEMEEMIKQGRAVVGVVIPEGYGKKVALHRQVRVLLVIDGSNIIYATNASTSILTVTRTIGAKAGIAALLAKGFSPSQAEDAYRGIEVESEPWFNPTLNYAYFLVLGLALNIWQQCCILTACMNVIGETGVESWRQIRAAGVSRLRLFFSKSVVHIVFFMLVVLPVYLLAFEVFKLPLRCGFMELMLFTLVFAVAVHSIGTLMSSFANSAVNSSRFGMIVAIPSFVISGFTWPVEAMPQWLRPISKFFPQTWFFQGINLFTFKNAGWEMMAHYMLVMAAIAACCYTLSALFISRS